VASIDRRPDGRWRARWREYPGGPQKSQHFGRKLDAERHLDIIRGDLARGVYVDPKKGRVTFKAFAEEWRVIQPHRPGTATSVEQDLRLHIYPALGDRPLTSIRRSHVQALATSLEQLAPSTRQRVYGRVTAVFRAAIRDRLIATSPCVEVSLGSARPTGVTEILTTEHVVDLAAETTARYGALIIAGAGTGLRPGELFGLATDRVDFLRRSIKVDQQLVRVRGRDGGRGGVELSRDLKTEKSYRAVPLPSVVTEALAGHMAQFEAHQELGLVFTNERGAPIQQHPFSVVFGAARDRAGLPGWVTPHALRHYYASLLIRSGASVKVVQARLGHASAKTTLDVYGHLWPDDEDRTRRAVDDAFAAPVEDQLRTADGH
jgi:integrase